MDVIPRCLMMNLFPFRSIDEPYTTPPLFKTKVASAANIPPEADFFIWDLFLDTAA